MFDGQPRGRFNVNQTAEEATCRVRETAKPRIFASRPPHLETLGLGALHVGRCGATADLVDGHSIRRVVAMLWMIVVSIPAFTAAPAVALIFFVINLFRRRWRAAASIVLACATFALVAVVSRRFHDELKWVRVAGPLRSSDRQVTGNPGQGSQCPLGRRLGIRGDAGILRD